MDNEEDAPGFIFMCNRVTKPECYRFRVFGLPAGRKHVVESIKPGTYLFLFDTDVKLLYGIYMAASTGMLNIEPFAFGRKFPAQVKFNIYKDCLPLPENHFKHAILDNYQRGSNKFNPDLNSRQVRNLLELFRPLEVFSKAPPRPALNEIYSPSTLPPPPTDNVFHQTSRSSLSEDLYLSRMSPDQAPRQSNYRHVNELAEPAGWAYPVNNLMPNSAAAQSVISQASSNQIHPEAMYAVTPEGTYAARTVTDYTLPLPDPRYTQQSNLNPQPEFHPSLVNQGSGHAQSLQDSQYTQPNFLHPQHEVHPSMMTMHSSYVQSMPDPHHQHHNILYQPADYHSAVVNTVSNHAQTSWDPNYNYYNVPNQQPDSYSSMANMGSNYAQSLPYPQHTHQAAQNANVVMQSHAWSQSPYYPYQPQEVVPGPTTHSSQGSGATQEVISSGQQTTMGSAYYYPASVPPTEANVSTQENVVSHLHSANSYSMS